MKTKLTIELTTTDCKQIFTDLKSNIGNLCGLNPETYLLYNKIKNFNCAWVEVELEKDEVDLQMSHFYGYLRGCRGTVTRTGSKDSGINARIKSWSNDVNISLDNDTDNKDCLTIVIPKGLKTIINGKVRRLQYVCNYSQV